MTLFPSFWGWETLGEQGIKGNNGMKVSWAYVLTLPRLPCFFNISIVNKQLRQMQSRKIDSPRVLIPSSFPLFVDFQGQKGESGSPGKNASGKIRFGDTSEKCTGSIAGTVRYNNAQKTLQLCDGSAWLPLVTAGKGLTSNNPGRHCLDILNSGEFKETE